MKKVIAVVLILLVGVLFGGCESNERLTNMTIVQAIGIDSSENGTAVSLQYLNLSRSVSTTDTLEGNITDVAYGSADSITDAVTQASKTLSREMFFGQNKIIVLGRDYAENHMDQGLDYILRSKDSRPDVIMSMSYDDAKSIVENESRGARVPAENIYKLLNSGEKNGLGAVVTVNDLLNMYQDVTSDIYLPVLKNEEDYVSCTGVAVFSDNKPAIMLDQEQTFGFLFVNDKIDGGSLAVHSETFGNIGLEITHSKTDKNVRLENGKIIFEAEIDVDLRIEEMEKGLDVEINDEAIKNIEQLINRKIQAISVSAFRECVEKNSDPFMVGRYVAKADEDYYRRVKDHWKENVKHVEIQVKVTSSVQRINSISGR